MRAREVRVIDESGTQLGVMHPLTALDLARQRGLDLVEVAPNSVPPVCRLMDYGRFRYEQTKRDRESRKATRAVTIKEVRLTPKIDEHDLMTKANSAKRFLAEGDKVKLTVRFRGRELAHTEIGQTVIAKVMEGLGDAVTVEQTPRMEGKSMSAVLAPKKTSARQSRPAEGDSTPTTRREEVETSAQA